jgi:hypothetical protein
LSTWKSSKVLLSNKYKKGASETLLIFEWIGSGGRWVGDQGYAKDGQTPPYLNGHETLTLSFC